MDVDVMAKLNEAAGFLSKSMFASVELSESEIEKAAESFADAFSEYHMLDWLLMRQGDHPKRVNFFNMEIRANNGKSVFIADSNDFNSLALLKQDCGEPASTVDYMKSGAGKLILDNGLRCIARMIDYSGKMAKARQELVGTNPWYLYYLGTRQAGQHKGLGSAILNQVTAYMDSIHSDIYLETNEYENVLFYNKFGFEQIGGFDYADFKCYCLFRKYKG